MQVEEGDKTMPIRQVPGHADLRYFLLSYTADGVEQTQDPDAPNGLLSDHITRTLASTPVSDVFLISHGWLGDVPAAIAQYDRWIGAMASPALMTALKFAKSAPSFGRYLSACTGRACPGVMNALTVKERRLH
jgi:hypothetical protein